MGCFVSVYCIDVTSFDYKKHFRQLVIIIISAHHLDIFTLLHRGIYNNLLSLTIPFFFFFFFFFQNCQNKKQTVLKYSELRQHWVEPILSKVWATLIIRRDKRVCRLPMIIIGRVKELVNFWLQFPHLIWLSWRLDCIWTLDSQ